MMERDVKARLSDFFTPSELIELLGLDIDTVIDIFEDEIEEALDDLEDIMGLRAKK